jgi:hypothetical protein
MQGCFGRQSRGGRGDRSGGVPHTGARGPPRSGGWGTAGSETDGSGPLGVVLKLLQGGDWGSIVSSLRSAQCADTRALNRPRA